MSIRTLAGMANINKTSLVRIEAGHSAYVSTILKICEALGIHLERLCQSERGQGDVFAIHRKADDRWYDLQDMAGEALADRGLTLQERRDLAEAGHKTQMLILKCQPQASNIISGLIELYESTKSRAHPGEEFIYVVEGKLRVVIGDRGHVLDQGEAIGFWPSEPHHYEPAPGSPLPVRFMCVRTDPK